MFESKEERKAEVDHVTVMPCYDKKLEAVRPTEDGQLTEVNNVLATHEILDFLKEKKIDLKKELESDMESESESESQFTGFNAFSNSAQHSNGYTEYIFRRAAKEIFK